MSRKSLVIGLALVWALPASGCLSLVIPEHHDGTAPAAPDLGSLPPPTDDGGVLASDDAAPPGSDDGGTAFRLAIEGESGTLTAPMAAMSDANASGGQYIAVPAGGTGGKAVFTFTVPHDGSYAIWGRVLAPADANNSFHVSIDSDMVDDDPSDGLSTIWDLPVSTTWTMVRVNMRVSTAGADMDLTFPLSAGSHTLYLNEREDSSQLDQLILTDDLTATP